MEKRRTRRKENTAKDILENHGEIRYNINGWIMEYLDVFFKPATALDYSYVWTFISQTHSEMARTDNTTSTTEAWTINWWSGGLSAIDGLYGLSWDTEQDFTISNFVYSSGSGPIDECCYPYLVGDLNDYIKRVEHVER